MKTRLAWILTAGGVLLLAGGFFLGGKLQENKSLRLDQAQQAEVVRDLEVRVVSLASITNDLTLRLARVEAERQASVLAASNAVVALAAHTAASHRPAATDPILPRAYQVPVYLGSQNLGLAWAIPTNVKRDPKTGLYACEQVIRLPDEARGSLTTYVTNLVEQTVYGPSQLIERDVYVDRGYSWVWAHPGHGGRPPSGSDPGHPPPVQPPTPPSPSRPPLYVPPRVGQPGIYRPPGLH